MSDEKIEIVELNDEKNKKISIAQTINGSSHIVSMNRDRSQIMELSTGPFHNLEHWLQYVKSEGYDAGFCEFETLVIDQCNATNDCTKKGINEMSDDKIEFGIVIVGVLLAGIAFKQDYAWLWWISGVLIGIAGHRNFSRGYRDHSSFSL